MQRPRLVLVDDSPAFLAAICSLVKSDCDVLSTLEDGQHVVDVVQSLHPDVVVLDIAMPVVNGITAARRLQGCMVSTKIIFLTAMTGEELALAAHELGASLILKRRMRQDLLPAIQSAMHEQS